MLRPQSINEIAEDTAADQPKSELAQHAAGIKMMAAQEQHHQRNDGNERQQRVVAPEEAPGRSGIAPKHEFKKSFDDYFLFGVAEEAQHDLLGNLVKRHHQHGDYGNSSIRGPQHGRYESHSAINGR